MVNTDMKGWATTWYEICTVDGHPLAIPQGENRFLTEEDAATAASEVCIQYRDTVTVKRHETEILRVFQANVTAEEV